MLQIQNDDVRRKYNHENFNLEKVSVHPINTNPHGEFQVKGPPHPLAGTAGKKDHKKFLHDLLIFGNFIRSYPDKLVTAFPLFLRKEAHEWYHRLDFSTHNDWTPPQYTVLHDLIFGLKDSNSY